MVANSVKDKTKLVYKDDEGRFIHVSYETDGQIFNFVSVYAPNNCIERARYFKFVNSYIENLQNVIIGGDFNTTLSNLDKGASGIDIDVTRLETLQLDLSKYELDKCKGAILRSKATWATEGDKNTKYFLNLEKYRQESNSVKELYNVKMMKL
ncbi:Hypothetical predicted protein [Mytilus galloprovincialis]|uniref:Endonuclease/exonuclease/phosphatase domain-containing protein n=1 Tax=Mytilus galloprovincialis TaxID=29158 RepID=A0A8B6H0V4_MYTGA|nr:Hypothetical predicted protein [Mytilus galloprovincialis]